MSDPDSGGNLTGATVTIGTGNISGDTLTINGTTSGTLDSGAISYAFTGSSLTLTGTATVAEYQAALRLVNYSFTSGGDPTNGGSDTSRGITWQVTDEANATASDTSTLSVMHEPPVVTANNPSVTFDGGGSAVPLDTGLTVSDPDSGGNLTGATVTIGTGNISGDTLTINGTTSGTLDSGAISYAFTGSSLTLTGTATVAEYQAALRLVNYSFTSGGDPTNGGSDTSRGITWQVTDEANATASDTSTLSVMHEPPVVTANNPSVTFDGGGSAVPLDTGLTVSDPDSGGNLTGATVTIGTGNISGDTLTINGTTSGTLDSGAISYAFTGSSLTLTGTATVAEYRAALRLVNYSFTSGGDPTNGGSDTSRGITWQVTDEANATASDTSTLSVMHEPPTVSAGATATFETGSATAVVLDSGLTVSDPDSGGNLTGATVTIGTGYVSGDDTLTINGTTSGTLDSGAISYSVTGSSLTLSGTATITAYQTALELVAFSTTSPNTGTPRSTIDWTVSDSASTLAQAPSTVDVVNGPVVSVGANPTVTYTEGGGVVALDPGLTIIDTATTTLASATVTITNAIAGDTLNFTNQNNITGSYIYNSGTGTGVLTLTGTDTVADYTTALEIDLVQYDQHEHCLPHHRLGGQRRHAELDYCEQHRGCRASDGRDDARGDHKRQHGHLRAGRPGRNGQLSLRRHHDHR